MLPDAPNREGEQEAMQDYLNLINTKTTGIRYDVTPLFADYSAFANLVNDLLVPFQDSDIDYVAGIDALGFILGMAVAWQLQKGFIPIRKAGKLPVTAPSISFTDYTKQQKALELRPNSFPPQSRILVVDEWIETGAQMQAALTLIENQQGIIVGFTTIHMDDNATTQALRARYRSHMVWIEGG